MGKDSKLAIGDLKCPLFFEANQSTVKTKDSFLYFYTSSSPVEANNSKSVNHSIVKSKDSYFHMSSSPVEASNSKSARFVHGG